MYFEKVNSRLGLIESQVGEGVCRGLLPGCQEPVCGEERRLSRQVWAGQRRFFPVVWIRDILDPDLRIRASEQWIQEKIKILLYSFKKQFFSNFSAYYFLMVHLHHFSKKKSHKVVMQNRRNQGFSYAIFA